ncbi:CRISPR-associated helicase Cas3' [Martelella alba]|uniref:CRISPR-associated helicase Cas3 n=1 Tax=Martelella alba TaxID=2590451 RepID=A0ABY2SG67_9HYPH|nr:CRISPR-associated helicase Cas3' [Martelella alba]TKI04083.1 CRISPR-associated helicase Cas3' [Martelella alba]
MSKKPTPDYLRYWGKARKKQGSMGDDYHLLAYHCLDVAACGFLMVKRDFFGSKQVLASCGMSEEEGALWIAYLFACHDIGKFARGFQRYAVFPDERLVPAQKNIVATERHDSLGFYLWGKIFNTWCEGDEDRLWGRAPEDLRPFRKALNIWMAISTGHHGMPPKNLKNSGALAFDEDDLHAARQYLAALNTLFPFQVLPETWKTKPGRKCLQEQSWFFAGLMTLADWMGSNDVNFPYHSAPMPLEQYWIIACEQTRQTLSRLPPISSNSQYVGYQALFPFIKELTPLQRCATTLDISSPGPQLIILEDVTGAGKTEAALILTHRLLSAKKGRGLYVGLPTMATANAMYDRLAKAYRALFAEDTRPSLVLAHGGRQMSEAFSQSVWQPVETEQEDYDRIDANAGSECHAWFADSRKKALLAEVGVGTIDQVLMAVMPFRHQSLRLLGMRDKILLLDEVHAYDSYMVKLLEGLLCFHAAQGGSAIILSATLPAALREKLLAAFTEGAGLPMAQSASETGYPWLSHLSSAGLLEQSLATRKEVRRTVAVNWCETRRQAIDLIYRAVSEGHCICWIRNTVDDALKVFQQLLNEAKIPEQDLLLFHSRFAFADRMVIEDKTLKWFGKTSTGNERRGKVLIATQVIEQSLDLDLDYMITDLAPIDLLIQRAGRLQRHIRGGQGQCEGTLTDKRQPPILHILAPEWQEEAKQGWLGDELRGSGFVYPDHACLWRTQVLLRQYGEIRMPEGARALVDGVYEESIPVPQELQTLSNKVYGKEIGRRAIASQSLLQMANGYNRAASEILWSEDGAFSTRLGEESTDVYLAWLDPDGQLQPVVGEGDFRWEKSRVQVRKSWWESQSGHFSLPAAQTLEQFRKRQHRPGAQVLLVSKNGEAIYYSKRLGLVGEMSALA